MKLLCILGTTFFLSLIVCISCAVVFGASIEGRITVSLAIYAILTVLFNFLVLWVTMHGQNALWKVLGVFELAVLLACLVGPQSAVLEIIIFGMVCLVVSSIPFLAIRTFGMRLLDLKLSRVELSRGATPCCEAEVSMPAVGCTTRSIQWTLRRHFLATAAVALVVGSIRLLLFRVSPQALERAFVSTELLILVLFVGVVCVLAVIGSTSCRAAGAWGARAAFLITFGGGFVVFRMLGFERAAIFVLFGGPTLSMICAGCGLYIGGFRLIRMPSLYTRIHRAKL